MSSATPGDLSAAAVIGRIDSGAYPRETVMTIARGFLPLAQEDLISVLAHLASGGDAEISGAARVALREVPPRAMFEYASNERIPGDQLIRLVDVTEDNLILESL